jgi:hypothetical protein
VMEQASKRSSSHEGGFLHDPIHKGSRFSVPMDREDRQQWVSAQFCLSVSGFPTLVACSPSGSSETGNTNRILLTCYFF